MTLRLRLGLGLFLIGALLGRGAPASQVYPEEIAGRLDLEQVPACTLCHRDDDGGLGTVIKPFGTSMQRLGASGGSNIRGLDGALSRAAADGTDSDRDGVGDIDELRAAQDPNLGLSGEIPLSQTPLPETGCRVGRSGSRAGAGHALLLLVCGGSLRRLAARRRRRAAGRYGV